MARNQRHPQREPKPTYPGTTINVSQLGIEQRRDVCRYVSKRTVYSRTVGANAGQAFGSLVVGVDRDTAINLGGLTGMWWEEIPAFEAANPGVVAATDEWIAWFIAQRGAR